MTPAQVAVADRWVTRCLADLAAAKARADASKVRWAAMTPEELYAETWGRETARAEQAA